MAVDSAGRRAYWRANLALTAVLLVIWAAVSFVPGWYAEDLEAYSVFGWPLDFYMAAQGSLIVFLVIVWLYDRCMRRLERRLGVRDERD